MYARPRLAVQASDAPADLDRSRNWRHLPRHPWWTWIVLWEFLTGRAFTKTNASTLRVGRRRRRKPRHLLRCMSLFMAPTGLSDQAIDVRSRVVKQTAHLDGSTSESDPERTSAPSPC